MKILRGYQKQTRAGDGKLKPQFPRPKQQEGCTFKDSYPKCFITTNFDKFHREAVAKGGEPLICIILDHAYSDIH